MLHIVVGETAWHIAYDGLFGEYSFLWRSTPLGELTRQSQNSMAGRMA